MRQDSKILLPGFLSMVFLAASLFVQGVASAQEWSACGVTWLSAGKFKIGLNTMPGAGTGFIDFLSPGGGLGDMASGLDQLAKIQRKRE
jgi:hypothetical protein